MVDVSRMGDCSMKNRSVRAMERESGESRRGPLPRLAFSDEGRPGPSLPGQLADSEDLDDGQVEDGVSASGVVRSRRGGDQLADSEDLDDTHVEDGISASGVVRSRRGGGQLSDSEDFDSVSDRQVEEDLSASGLVRSRRGGGRLADNDVSDDSLVEEAAPARGSVRSRRGTVATGVRGHVSSRPGQHADSDTLDDSMVENAVPSSGKKQSSGLFRSRRGAGRSSRRTVEAGVSGPDPSPSGQLADSNVLDDSLVEEAGPPSGWVRSRRGTVGSRRGTDVHFVL
jgi:hypothetical protein